MLNMLQIDVPLRDVYNAAFQKKNKQDTIANSQQLMQLKQKEKKHLD